MNFSLDFFLMVGCEADAWPRTHRLLVLCSASAGRRIQETSSGNFVRDCN